LENERQLLPFIEGVDGAYVATFRRKSKTQIETEQND
jgi:hypothetical protein